MLRQELGHLRLEKAVLDLDAVVWEAARLQLAWDAAIRDVADFVHRGDRERGAVVVVGEREQRHPHAPLGGADREAREDGVAHLDVALHRPLDAKRDECYTARRVVSRRRQHLDLRRREIDRHGPRRHHALRHPQRAPEIVPCAHFDGGRALAQTEVADLERRR